MIANSNDINSSALILNLDKLHTTEMGVARIKRNLLLKEQDVVQICKAKIQTPHATITRRGKNWYVCVDHCEITINAHSFTIITAHRIKEEHKAV